MIGVKFQRSSILFSLFAQMNSALRERQIIVGNLRSRLHQHPLAGAFLGVFGLILRLLILIVLQRLEQQGHMDLIASVQRWPFLIWATIFLFCLAMQRPIWFPGNSGYQANGSKAGHPANRAELRTGFAFR